MALEALTQAEQTLKEGGWLLIVEDSTRTHVKKIRVYLAGEDLTPVTTSMCRIAARSDERIRLVNREWRSQPTGGLSAGAHVVAMVTRTLVSSMMTQALQVKGINPADLCELIERRARVI